MRIGLIGTGHIGAPIVRYLALQGHELWISKRNQEISASLAREFENVNVRENDEIVTNCSNLFLALRPDIVESVLKPLAFGEHQRICSVMARTPMAKLQALCAPASEISITIPLGFLENGGCPLPVYGASQFLKESLGASNPILEQSSEAALNAHFAASTLITTTLSALISGKDWLADKTQDEDRAEIYVNQLLSGFLRDVPKTGAGELARARGELGTEGTLNLQMWEEYNGAGIDGLIRTALDQIQARMEEK